MGRSVGLAEEQRRALDRLTAVPGIERFYLAGGSAIAVHLGHRRSVDLDLFSFRPDVDLGALAASLRVALAEAEVVSLTDAALRIRVAGVPVDAVRYPYALLEDPLVGRTPLDVARLPDLAAMKLAAIARRGIRRDFWDLYAIARAGLGLADALAAYSSKFGPSESDLYHVLRALTYFADAERDPVRPAGMSARLWTRVRRFFEAEAPRLLTVR